MPAKSTPTPSRPRPGANTTSVDNPPLYCSQDGKMLLSRKRMIPMGFDPFTGEARPARQHVTLHCQLGHDVWVLSDDGALWVKP